VRFLSLIVRRDLYKRWNADVRRAREEYARHPFADMRLR